MTRPTKDMTKTTTTREQLLALLQDDDALRGLLQTTVQEVLEAEMDEALGAGKGERTGERRGYRSGYYGRKLTTRVGTLELRVPQDRGGLFRTEVFTRYQRSEKALLLALAEMYVQGVSTRKVRAVTEELCGHGFSASSVSAVTVQLDAELERFMHRPLTEDYAYLILDARYERVREAGVIRSRAVLVALGIDWEGRRQVLAVELANRESTTAWRDFLIALKQRGLSGVHLVVTDDHEGLKKAVAEVLPTVLWQRCYVHFLRNALDHLPRSADRACLQELRWLYASPRRRRSAHRSARLARPLARQASETVRLGRSEHRGNLRLLPAATSPPQTPQINQPARAAQPGVQTAHPHRAHLHRRAVLPAAHPRPRRRDPRRVDRRQPLPQYGATARAAQETRPRPQGRLKRRGG